MSDHRDDRSTALDDEFERLGRRAGAELRTSPPPDGHRLVEGTSNRRGVAIATITTVATVAVIVTGLMVARHEPRTQQDNQPVEVATPTPTSVVATAGVAGSWRALVGPPMSPIEVRGASRRE